MSVAERSSYKAEPIKCSYVVYTYFLYNSPVIISTYDSTQDLKLQVHLDWYVFVL